MATQLTMGRDESGYVITASFKDESSAAVIPNSIRWDLTDRRGNIINSHSSEILAVGSTVTVVLRGDDMKYSDGDERIFTIRAKYDSTNGTSIPLNAEARFHIENLVNV